MGNSVKSIKEYSIIAFTLIGILFGMMLMTFIFGQLGNSSTVNIADETLTVTNRTEVFLNGSTYTIPEASYSAFNGGFTVLFVINSSDLANIPSANYTVDSALGTIINATAYNSPNMSITYSYSSKVDAKLASENVQNNSLQGIVTYTNNSGSQFTTVSIAIILVLLVGVFLLFWNIFVKDKSSKKSGFGGNFG